MNYSAFSLNGTWEMNYSENKYTGTENPWNMPGVAACDSAGVVSGAVPGYWEDMTDAFSLAPFFRTLKINPEYGLQRYPISGFAPDMALPNIYGNFFYRKTFCVESISAPAALHFGGVQNAVSVWINDVYLGRHEGYSAPFDINIPEGVLADGENTVVLSVSNHRLEGYAGEPVSGLTSRAANECTGGITGEVELRVYNCPLRDVIILISDNCRRADVRISSVGQGEYRWYVKDGERIVKSGAATGDFSFDTAGLELWSPESPRLYTLELVCGDGSVSRIFGVRSLVADGPHFRLNGVPYYLRGICEHCYFPDTIHPAHDLTYYRSIVKSVKKLGFNFIRFHTYIPEEEYMQAADELGMLVHVECPNNTTYAEWEEIVRFCRRHTSVVIYCCGNELQIDEPFIAHLNKCADYVHANTDALFSPMSAMRGLEYNFIEPEQEAEVARLPIEHHPRRLRTVGEFSDMYSSYVNAHHSYESLKCDVELVDEMSGAVYNHKPRVSHEICIDGTYTDLSLKNRYEGTRVGKTDMFSSVEAHLESKGLLGRAPLYFKNSSEWQRRVRKHCFEVVRRSENMAGYDFLGPIDTHWHTFGYDVGMMNEFYELKPGETIRNVKMYNSESVLLTDLGVKSNFASGENLACGIYISCYSKEKLKDAVLTVRLSLDDRVIVRRMIDIDEIENGRVSKLYDLCEKLPEVESPCAMKLYVTLDGGGVFGENEWELYLFPEARLADRGNLTVSCGMTADELREALRDGRDVVIFGTEPFDSIPTSFRISLAGRTSGNLATVISDHPLLKCMPHDGFCGWQFAELMEDGAAVSFENSDVPFNPIIEVVSSHKYVIRQAALFEFKALNGRLLVCSFKFFDDDPAAVWLKSKIIDYAKSREFAPVDYLDEGALMSLVNSRTVKAAKNTNLALNLNDKTAVRRNK